MNEMFHLSGIMFDAKLHRGHPRPEVKVVQSVIVVTLLQERAVGGLGEIGFVVQKMQNADRFLRDQTDNRLIILNTNVLMKGKLQGSHPRVTYPVQAPPISSATI